MASQAAWRKASARSEAALEGAVLGPTAARKRIRATPSGGSGRRDRELITTIHGRETFFAAPTGDAG